MSGLAVSRLKRVPWVLEIRDLWPESIIAVGALTQPRIISFLESVEAFLYRRATHVVALTKAFKGHIVACGVDEKTVSIITNGADLGRFAPMELENRFRTEHCLEGKFVASYIGTHGMAHGLETVFAAAEKLQGREDIVFLLVGDGAERSRLLRLLAEKNPANVLMLPQQPKERIPEIIAASNVCLVLLKAAPLFRTVIPSKIFEAMAMKRPIILGVRGESRAIVEQADCGICIEPENSEQLALAVTRLADDTALGRRKGSSGHAFVTRHYSRDDLARKYRLLLERLCHAAESPN
jgi:glycosyltransferase involved in cell wall biosynthesis